MFRTQAQETASQRLWENCSKEAGGGVRLYTSLQQREQAVWTSKIRSKVKEFSILCMGRCKPLGSLNSFFSYAPQLSGAWRRQWHPTPVLLPRKSHGQRSLVGYRPWGCQESYTTEWLYLLTYYLGLILFPCSPCFLHSPSSSAITMGAGSIGWISVLEALRSNCQHPLDHGKSKRVPVKTSISPLLTMPKPLTVWITINCGKFWKRWEYHTIWPASWEICMQVRKQQLELDMEQQTGSK